MSKTGPIVLVDDDLDDLENMTLALQELGIRNKIIAFTGCDAAYSYLIDPQNDTPFIIFSDINLPMINGVDLKRRIDANPILKRKSIPFIYYSTSGDEQYVKMAFEYNVQGFFVKGNTYNEIKNTFRKILDYWSESRQPSV